MSKDGVLFNDHVLEKSLSHSSNTEPPRACRQTSSQKNEKNAICGILFVSAYQFVEIRNREWCTTTRILDTKRYNVLFIFGREGVMQRMGLRCQARPSGSHLNCSDRSPKFFRNPGISFTPCGSFAHVSFKFL